jgi:hypothetical protein
MIFAGSDFVNFDVTVLDGFNVLKNLGEYVASG